MALVRISDQDITFGPVLGEFPAVVRSGSVFDHPLRPGEVLERSNLSTQTEFINGLGFVSPTGFEFVVAVAIASVVRDHAIWLCGFGLEPRELSDSQRRGIQDLAALAQLIIDDAQNSMAARREMLDQAAVGVWAVDANREIRFVNRHMAELLGWQPSEMIGTKIDLYFAPEALAIALNYIRASEPDKAFFQAHSEHIDRNGNRVPVQITASSLTGPSGERIGAFAVVSKSDQPVEPRPKDKGVKFETMVRHSPDVMLVFGDNRKLKYLSAAAGQFGWVLSELESVFDVIHPDDRDRTMREFGRIFDGNSDPAQMVTFRVRTKSGEHRYLESRAIDLRNDPDVAGVVISTRDVTERVLQSDRLAHAARHDYLTDLPNRSFLIDQLGAALTRSQRTNQPVLLCFLDVNAFKSINDRFGHAIGDQVLIAIGERIRGTVRAGDMPARFGGDEFVIVCETVHNEAEASEFLQRLQSALDQPCDTSAGTIACTVTVGHAFSHYDDTPEILLARADTVLFERKPKGAR